MTAVSRAVFAVAAMCLFSFWSVPASAQCCFNNGASGLDCNVSPSPCCSGLCEVTGGIGTCVACLDVNQACSTNSQCCTGVCFQGPFVDFCVCQGANEPCSTDNNCCAPNTCGGGGTPGVCGCTPESDQVACGNHKCGSVVNNCGQTVQCGTCSRLAPKCCSGLVCVPATRICP
jgi:hypothetical protein